MSSYVAEEEACWQVELAHRKQLGTGPRLFDRATGAALDGIDYELALRALVRKLRTGTGPERAHILAIIDWSDDGRALVVFLRSLDDLSAAVRAEAAFVLGRRRLPSWALERVVAGLNDVNWLVRARVCRALGRSSIAEAVIPLMDALRDRIPQVRAAAAEGLMTLDQPMADRALADAAEDPVPQVRAMARLAGGVRMRQGSCSESLRRETPRRCSTRTPFGWLAEEAWPPLYLD